MEFSQPQAIPNDFFRDLNSLGYSNIQQLGQGGMGTVFRAYKENLDRTVAIKVVSQDRVSNQAYVQRFHAEMRTMASLDHPAIVPVFDGGVTASGIPYFVMKYIQGQNVHDYLHRRRAIHQPLSVGEVAGILAPIASALDYLASRPNPVVHRDIKPANILLPTPSAQGVHAMLTDFGIAVDQETTRVTRVGMRIGTDGYSAPELFATKDVANPPQPNSLSEQYSLGLVAYEMLTGIYVRGSVTDEQWVVRRPVPEVNADLIHPADVAYIKRINRVLARVLSVNPKKRFSTSTEFIDALRKSVEVDPEGAQSKDTNRGRYTKSVITLASVASVIVAATFAYAMLFSTSEWKGEDKKLAAFFPQIISEDEGGRGWESTTCEHRDPGTGELARIACNSDNLSVVVARFESVDARSAVMPLDSVQLMKSERCSAETMPIGSEASAYGVFPQGDYGTFGFIVSGKDATTKRLALPIC